MSSDQILAKLLVNSVWFSRPCFEEAETRQQEYIGREHAGLKIEGTGIPDKTISSDIVGLIGEAKSRIEQGLKDSESKTLVLGGQSVFSDLEKENTALKKRVQELETFIRSKGLDVPGAVTTSSKPQVAAKKNEDDDDDDDDEFDPFASDDEKEGEEARRIKEERLAAYAEKKSKKPALIAKSSIILDIKPWDDETDMAVLEREVRKISADGLDWKGSKLVDVAYGIKKLQIICIVEDEKVGTDFLEEEICGLEDLVQSIDIVAFNKL